MVKIKYAKEGLDVLGSTKKLFEIFFGDESLEGLLRLSLMGYGQASPRKSRLSESLDCVECLLERGRCTWCSLIVSVSGYRPRVVVATISSRPPPFDTYNGETKLL